MRDYGIVSPRFWIGETGKKLRGDANCQVLAMYLMTSPHATMTGVYHCPVLYMAHETGLSLEGATKALRRLIDEGYCQYDEASEYVFVIRMAAHQIGESLHPKDRRVDGLKKDVEKMQEPFKSRFLSVYGVVYHLVKPAECYSPFEPPCEPHRSQDQDQDQKKEEDVELHSTAKVNGKHATPPGDVEAVFEHWREAWAKRKAKLDPKRKRVIQAALKAYPLAELCKAISGYRNSPHHRGENERRTPYDDIELFLRDSKHIEAGLQFAEKNPGGVLWQ